MWASKITNATCNLSRKNLHGRLVCVMTKRMRTSTKRIQRTTVLDFECIQENGTHEPNLCVIQNEAGDEWVFQGDNTRNEFCEWLFTKEHEGCIMVAHNFQGYDGYFIQQYLHENGVIPEVIIRCAKILTLYVPMLKIKFIDSFSFIPIRLADFPKTFGLNELAKVYFPHLFNRKENQKYVDPYHRVLITIPME
jgi:hypothetical protein